MAGGPLFVAALVAALACLLLVAPVIRGESPSASPATAAVQYFRLDPGTPTQTGTVFDVPIFVMGEPAGSVANRSEVQQTWQDLQVVYLGGTPATFTNWSVPAWGLGRFDLRLSLTGSEIGAIEGGQALLALNSSIMVGTTVLGAAGTIDGPVLISSVVVGAWWSTIFGIQTSPPDPSFSSFQGIIADLAWFGSSTAGRAAYAGTTLVAISLYLWEGHKLARAKLVGTATKPQREAA
jgi:hypothetical protein